MNTVSRWVLCALMALGQAAASRGQVIQDPSVLTAGRWEAVPLAERSQPVPDSKDTTFIRFQNVGTSKAPDDMSFNLPDPASWYMADDGMLVFWAGVERKGATEPAGTPASSTSSSPANRLELARRIDAMLERRDWALFSIKDGKVTKICTDGVALPLPGGSMGFIRRSTSRIVPTKDKVLIYFDDGKTFSFIHGVGYAAWDGQKFSEFIQKGQTRMTSEGTFEVKSVLGLGRTEDGNVWILLHAKDTKGNQWMYWTWDGTTFRPVLSTKGKWPGTPYDAKINGFRREELFLSSGILLHVEGGAYSGSILKIHDSKTVELLKAKAVQLLLETKYIASTRLSSAASADVFALTTQSHKKAFERYFHSSLLFYNKGKTEKVFDKEMTASEKDKAFWINDGLFLSGSPIAYVFSAGNQWTEGSGSKEYTALYEAARLYSYDGTTVTPLAKDLLVEPHSMRLLKTPLGKIVTLASRDELRLVQITIGADGKQKSVEVEDEGKRRNGIVHMSSSGASYLPSPKFSLSGAGPEITLSDVVGWTNDREAIALCEAGVYRLKRVD